MTAPRIHIADRPAGTSGKARGRCGLWSLHFTSRPEEATCLRCLGIKPPPPPDTGLARKITPEESTD